MIAWVAGTLWVHLSWGELISGTVRGQEETCGRGDGGEPLGAGDWADETRAVLANCEVQNSAFSVAQRDCDGGRRDGPPWPPLLKGGSLAQHCRREISVPSSAYFRQPGRRRAPNDERFRSLNPYGTRARDESTKRNRGRGTKRVCGDGAIENLEAGQREGGETGCQEDVGGDELPAPLGEEGCVGAPRVPEPLSKRERRRQRREMARKEVERRRGVMQKEPDVSVSVEKMPDSAPRMLPNSVAFLRKPMPRAP